MKFTRYFLLILVIGAVFFHLTGVFASSRLSTAEASARIGSGKAVLVDVREPGEWTDGVVEGALLLPLGDLRGARTLWAPALKTYADKEFILYCRSGVRSEIALRLLKSEGFNASNAGSFSAWKQSGASVTKP